MLFIAVPLFIYYHGFHNDFMIWDDNSQVYENEEVKNINFENLKIIFTTNASGMYQPLTSLLFGVVASIFGVQSAFPFHLLSFLLHIINVFLLYFLGRKLLKNETKAILLALLFSAQHMTVEAVSWISATSTLLFSLFFMISMLFYIRFLEKSNKTAYYLSLVFFSIGCFCKVQIVPFVGVLFLLDFLYKKKYLSKKMLLLKLPFTVVALLFVCIGVFFRESSLVSNSQLPFNNLYFGLNQFFGYINEMLTLPHYSIIRMKDTVIHFQVILLFVLFYLIYRFKNNKLFVFGILFFIMNVVLQTTIFTKFNNPYNDRYMYLSGMGIWIAILSFGNKRKHLFLISIFVVFQILLAKATAIKFSNAKEIYIERSHEVFKEDNIFNFRDWQFQEKVAEGKTNTFIYAPVNSKYGVFNNLGILFARFGIQNSSEWCFLKAIEFNPNNADIYKNLAKLFVNQDLLKTEEYYVKAIEIQPASFELYINIGCLYTKFDLKKAESSFLKAMKLNPSSHIAPMNLGIIYSKDNWNKSEEYLLKALSLNPENLKLNKNLGILYKNIDAEKSKLYMKRSEELISKINWKK